MNIEVKVTLQGFEKEIERIIAVNDNMPLKKFCEGIIIAMNGWVEHLYSLKCNEIEYMSNGFNVDDFDAVAMGNKKLELLNLQPKDKMILEYDPGDGWLFKIQVKKITEGYREKNFIILSGKGKGIIEDCGGIWGLEEFVNHTISAEMEEWYLSLFEEEMYDINDFSLDSLNNYLDSIYNKKSKK